MRTTFLACLLGAVIGACAPEAAGDAKAPTSTPCSAEDCAGQPEPPISPMACGAGHENEIGTTCGRAPSGECRKTLTCGGKRPE